MRYLILISLLIPFIGCQPEASESDDNQEDALHIVFVTGDEEYRSEESMPMLARILKNRYGFKVTVVYAISDGVIDPNRLDNISGLDVLTEADMMVMFTRFRNLPDHQLQYILDFAESGKPMAGFRTSTHAFQYGENHTNQHLDFEWPQSVFGLPWISHHGAQNSTRVDIISENSDHPVLNGINPFHARSWLYHSTNLLESATPLLVGSAIVGAVPGGNSFGDPQIVAWLTNYEGSEGTSRVFFTTLGHPEDFYDENMRRLSIQGIYWALGLEDQIPKSGLNMEIIGEYDPNPAGFGEQFKQGLRPEEIPLEIPQDE